MLTCRSLTATILATGLLAAAGIGSEQVASARSAAEAVKVAMAPDCDTVAAALRLGPDGLAPNPNNDPHPAIDGVKLYAAVGDDRSIVAQGYDAWLRYWVIDAGPKPAALRRKVAAAGVSNVCFQLRRTSTMVPGKSMRQASSGNGWRLVSTGVGGGSAVSVAGDAAGAAKLYDRFGVAAQDRRSVDYSRSLLIAYSTIHSTCDGEGPRFAGWKVDPALHIVDPALAPGPSAAQHVVDGTVACNAVAASKYYIVAASRRLFPKAKMIFRNCTMIVAIRQECSVYAVVDLSSPVSLVSFGSTGPFGTTAPSEGQTGTEVLAAFPPFARIWRVARIVDAGRSQPVPSDASVAFSPTGAMNTAILFDGCRATVRGFAVYGALLAFQPIVQRAVCRSDDSTTAALLDVFSESSAIGPKPLTASTARLTLTKGTRRVELIPRAEDDLAGTRWIMSEPTGRWAGSISFDATTLTAPTAATRPRTSPTSPLPGTSWPAVVFPQRLLAILRRASLSFPGIPVTIWRRSTFAPVPPSG